MESILTSIKKQLGIVDEYDHFDPEIIMSINSALFTLNQIGVGPSEGFSIKDKNATWSDFTDISKIEAVKTYVCMKVRLVFDPPASSAHLESMKNQINELEWRLNVAVDPPRTTS